MKALVGAFNHEIRDYEPSGGPSFEALMLTVFPRWVVSGPTPAQQQMVVAETCLGQVHNAGPVCQVHISYLHIYIYTTLMYLYFDMCRCWTSPAPWTRTTTPRSAGRSTRCISRSRENIRSVSPFCHSVMYPSGCWFWMWMGHKKLTNFLSPAPAFAIKCLQIFMFKIPFCGSPEIL